MNHTQLYDKIKGALYGVAVGDALGGPFEFMNPEQIKAKHNNEIEMVGGGWLNLRPGETTDDTAMTLAVAEGILTDPEDPVPHIGKNFIKWYASMPKDVGATCASVISNAMATGALTENQWLICSHNIHKAMGGRTAGNGGLMRTVYVGLYYKDLKQMADMAKRISQMTHYSDESGDHCVGYSLLIDALSKGEDWDLGHEFTLSELKPTGYVKDSWNCARFALVSTSTFEEALTAAIRMGGDADTIGAIAGGVAGAKYGYSSIPERWINALDDEVKAKLDYLAEQAYLNRNRKKPFEATYYETLERKEIIYAVTSEEAYAEACRRYRDEEVVLGSEDMTDREIEVKEMKP